MKENKIILIDDASVGMTALAIAMYSAQKNVAKMFVCLELRADEASRRMTELTKAMTLIKDSDVLITGAKSQRNNWSRRGKYEPIYRRSNTK